MKWHPRTADEFIEQFRQLSESEQNRFLLKYWQLLAEQERVEQDTLLTKLESTPGRAGHQSS